MFQIRTSASGMEPRSSSIEVPSLATSKPPTERAHLLAIPSPRHRLFTISRPQFASRV